MFRALSALQKEGFTSADASAHTNYVAAQTKRFTQQYPNIYPTTSTSTNILQNASSGLSTWDPNTRQSSLRDINIASYATSIQANQELLSANAACKTSSLANLINTYNPNDKLRCGWIYKKGTNGAQPAVSQGALGTRRGAMALNENPSGTWYWDLEAAEKAMLSDRCSALTSCQNVGSPGFEGCAFSTTKGTGIPVNTNGSIRYPNDDRLTAPLDSLVTNVSKCPAPPPAGSLAAEVQRSRDICTPLPDGRFSRDCMLQQITLAGCQPDGALYQQLVNNAKPNDYANGLRTTTSFTKYKELSKNPLLESAIKDGSTTLQTALASFKELAVQSQTVQNTALSFAARDLCLKSGTMDDFDFCDELTGTSKAPFALECLQKEFRRQGGQPNGSKYPKTDAEMTYWNNLGTWQNVKNAIQDMKSNLNSATENLQRQGLTEFLGITRSPYEKKQIGKIQGIEVFWFNMGTKTFIGRRIASKFPDIGADKIVDNTGLANNVEHLVLANLRPPTEKQIKLKITTDDGVYYTLNKYTDHIATRQTSTRNLVSTEDSFGANWIQAPTTHLQSSCWTLKANGPNYIQGYWQESGGFARLNLTYANCNGVSYHEFPSEWIYLTQEPDAPMISWEYSEQGAFVERRMPKFFELRQMGTTLKDQTKANYPYQKELQLTDRTSFAETINYSIGMNSWRTITATFHTTNQNTGNSSGYILFSLGDNFSVSILGANLIFKLSTANLSVNKTFTNVLDTTGTNANYIYLNCRSEVANTFPNIFTIAVGKLNDFKNKNINLGLNGANVEIFTTVNRRPVFNQTDSAKLYFGDRSGQASAKASIGALRFFDYELDSGDLARDAKNEWLMVYPL